MISNVTCEKTETHFKKSLYVQIAKVAVTLIVSITMIGLFIGLSEDSDSQIQVLQLSQVNLTENPTTTTIASATGKCMYAIHTSLSSKEYLKCN